MTDRVLVTGATGFIAQHCMLQLLGGRLRGGEGRPDRPIAPPDVVAILSPQSQRRRARSTRRARGRRGRSHSRRRVGAVPSRGCRFVMQHRESAAEGCREG